MSLVPFLPITQRAIDGHFASPFITINITRSHYVATAAAAVVVVVVVVVAKAAILQ